MIVESRLLNFVGTIRALSGKDSDLVTERVHCGHGWLRNIWLCFLGSVSVTLVRISMWPYIVLEKSASLSVWSSTYLALSA